MTVGRRRRARILGFQGDRLLLTATALFAVPAAGPAHTDTTAVEDPDDLPNMQKLSVIKKPQTPTRLIGCTCLMCKTRRVKYIAPN